MALTTEEYNNHTITLNEEENQPAVLKINDRPVEFKAFENGRFHAEYFPYQDFETPMELAKYVIDNFPNFGSGSD